MRMILLAAPTVCALIAGCSADRARMGTRDQYKAAAPAPGERMPAEKDKAGPEHNTEAYDRVVDNEFLSAARNPLSTFSIDVDTASYSNVRRFLQNRQPPPKDAVRIEELINYFPYSYPPPADGEPFRADVEIASAPWNDKHRLVRIGIKGREIPLDKRPPSNLVFLIDVSGSMNDSNKLPLVKRGLRMLVEQFTENDRVAIVVYAGASGLVLPSTTGDQRGRILGALDGLAAGGSTNGGAGIQLAYDTAISHFIKGGTNRVILCTDGDFNVGTTDQGGLTRLIEDRRRSGVFLSVLGFGMGNYKDSTLEQLADKGNGNYAYIDNEAEARKVFVEQMAGTLITIAKDVKIQVEFNPAKVSAYRLIGYENRLLAAEDFKDDAKDAGEIGSDHTVTALYEIVPAGTAVNLPGVDPLKYQTPANLTDAAKTGGELLTVKVRAKKPDAEVTTETSFPVTDDGKGLDAASADYKFAASVAAFGMLLRDSPHKGSADWPMVRRLAEAGRGADPAGHRAEFLRMVSVASDLPRR
jgi:Ca-activated chloride channel family protein